MESPLFLYYHKDPKVDDVISEIAKINGKNYYEQVSLNYDKEYPLLGEIKQKSNILKKILSKKYMKIIFV